MKTAIDPKLRPFLAQLKRMEVGLFTAHPEFDAILLQYGFEDWWKAEETIQSSPFHFSTESVIKHREDALWSMFQKLYTSAPGAVKKLGIPILSGCMKWKPNDVHLLDAIAELKKLTLNDSKVVELEDRIKAQRARGSGKRSETVVGKPNPSVTISNKVFIVHGHAEADRLKLVKLLKDDMGLEPIVVQDEPNMSLESILNKIERLADQCHAAIVLLTPDDETATGKRARQNVVLELGYFIGRWRESDERRIIVLKKGELEAPSDILGVAYISYEKDPEDAHVKLSKQFRQWGFKIV
jgi:predicted nucleotide-binding protein